MLRHKPTRISLDETDLHFHLSRVYARHPEYYYYYYYYEGDGDMDDQLSLHSDTPSSSVPTHISESICDGEDVAPAGQNPYPGLRCNTAADIVLSSRSSSLVTNPGSDMKSPTQTCLSLNKEIEELCTNTTCGTHHDPTPGGLVVQLTSLIDLALSTLPGDTVYQANKMAKRGRAKNKQAKAGVRETSSDTVSMGVEDGNNPVWDINANANLPHAEERKEGNASHTEAKIPAHRRCDFSSAVLRETNEPPRPYDRSILDIDPPTTFVNENVTDTKRRGQDNQTNSIMYGVRPEIKAVNHGLVHPILMDAYHFHNYVNDFITEVQGGRVDDIAELGLRNLEPFKVPGDELQIVPQVKGGGDQNDELDY
ncbi:hypothetical protein P168DRAFT_323657 [Aspergillus campestris IBT 28561]|uniref:Uncharacterized protein n=1 Tax=Aspergillus campestris (strain IBT 28561) TaxID=1392248 RepID=A0A2I1DF91_ASPC2|nr:uncharacterized protein P168DRAFT_323657 [Aspergillus campestris IBT 28561]PKY08545.1 hypothetical protein P168DRAFT_323657 [Aspergillus campestris IBT 28561]